MDNNPCSSGILKRNPNNINNIEIELIYLIAKYLSVGPCKKSFEVLRAEIEENRILPRRIDWHGNEHEITFNDYDAQNGHIAHDYLLQVVSRLEPTIQKLWPTFPEQKWGLLGRGSQSLLRSENDAVKVYKTLSDVLVRQNGNLLVEPSTVKGIPNATQSIIGREICGTTRRKHFLTNKFYSRLHLFVRNVGHLSAIYCMLFDRCGRYIITGADDMLVKIWSVIDGRLVATLRGASAEISDLALDQENTLLAAGSCDKIIRVWSLQNLAPIAVLSSHTGMITALQFCPAPNRDGVLVSTGGDGCVAFWSYTRNKMDVKFNPKPLKLNERVRPGHAQLICASFSTGGNFLAVGGADHFVRVYKIGGPDGMEKLIETEIHTDRVDSIQWRHCGIEFVSGSRDGTALIWRYQSQQWRTTTLNMNQLLPGFTLPEEDSKKLQVTMVGWDRTDKLVITASSDHLLRVWDSRTGELKRILEGHEDNAYVIEAHPTDDRLILTAGHDGLLFIWDVIAGVAVKSFKNTIEGQGHGALFDAKWAPDGLSIATTDSHGHILIFGMGQNELFKKIPQELFFHTDYRPLVRDINHHVLDEQTQLAPHLMPPPFLVNIDGDPYPPELQRLVPGRENCRVDQLIPNVVTNDNGEQEVLDLAIADVEHHLPAPIGQPPGRPPDEGRLDLLGGGRRNIDEMIERLAQEQEERRGVSERNRDELPGPSNAGSSERRSSSSGGPHPDHSYAVAAAPNALSPRAGRVGSRREGDIEGVRQSTGNWQRDPHMKWKRQMFVTPLSISALEQSKQFRLTNKELELASYNEEIKKGPDTPQTKRSEGDEGEREGRRNRRRQRKTHAYSTRANRGTTPRSRRGTGPGRRSGQSGAPRVPRAQIAFGADFEDPDTVLASQDRQQQEEEEEAALSSSSSSSSSSSIAKEALEEEESSDEDSDNSTDYSDWTADVVGAGLEPPKRTAHKQKTNPVAARKRKRRAAKKDDGAEREESEDEVDDDEEEMRNNKKVKEEKEEAGERRIRRKRRRRGEREEEEEETNEENEKKRPSNARRKRDARNLNMAESDMEVDEIPPEFRLPDWLGETVPKKAPYFPQMGDEIMYFRQGHQLYVEAVLSRQLYQIDKRSLPWIRKHNLRDQEYVKIIGIKFEIKPPRLCCLKLGIMDMDGVLTGDSFTIKYHDMPDVLDFLVLKNTYDTAVRRNWKSGDRFRCIIDDAWWIGTVETQEPHLPEFPDSMFMCYRVLWDNGERERLSPWDMEPIDDYMELPDAGGSVQVSPEEYKNLVYTPSPEEWEAPSFEAECQRMGEGIGKIMELAAAEPFLAPVDLNVYPNYAMVVAYPMDLSTIKSRLESHFYRRPNAVQFDVRYIATNAEKFNKKGSVIVRNARIITELALRLIKDPSCRDPTLYYHEAQANYQSPSHSEDEERKRMRPDSDDERTRRRTRGREIPLPQGDGTIVLPKSTQDNRPWQQQCRDLLKSMFERQDSIPFRFPVDLSRFEDYSQVIDVPMDLSTIREELAAGAYASPLDFAKDVRLVFQNSKNYNTNNKSRIYSMTVRLEAFFEDQIKGIFARCKNKGKGKGGLQKGPRKPRGTSQAPSGEKHDNRTIMPPRLSFRTTTTASVEQLKKSEIGLAAGPSGSCKSLSEVQTNGVSVGASDVSDDDDGDEALRGSVNEGGKRRSRRVARLRQLQDDDEDSDDEEYTPIKKNTQKSPRESRQTLGGRAVTGRSLPVAATDKREKGGPVKRTASRKINFHDDDSDSGTTSKRSSPLLNSRSKRIRLVESSKASSGSSEISSEDESEDQTKPTTSSTLDDSHRPMRAPVKKYIKSESSSSEEEPPVDAVDSIKNALTSHFAKKRRIDSSDTENSLMNGTKEEEEEEGEAVKGDDDEDEEGDEEDDDEEAENKIKTENRQINEEEEEESRHEIKNDGDNDEEEDNDDDDNEDDNDDDDDEEGDNVVAENEEAEDEEEEEEEEEEKKKEKAKIASVNSLHRQRLTLASFGKRKKEEESDFEFDEEELEEESEEEEEDEEKDRKRKSGGRGRKRPSRGRIVMRRSRRRALHGDEDFDDDDDDDFVADDFIDDGDAFSSSSSSSDSEDESSDTGGRRKSRKKKKISLKEKEKRKQQAKRERQKKARALARKKAKEAKAKAKAKEKAMKARQKAREREKIKKAKEAAKKKLTEVKLGRGTENTNPSISFESRISISAKMASQIPQISATNLQQTSISQNQRQSPCHSQIKQTSVHPSIMHHSPIRSPVRSQIPIPNVAQQLQQIPVSPHAQVASHYRQGSVNAQLHQAPVSGQFHQVPISAQIPQNSVNPQIHQAPIATQYHQASIGTQIHQAPANAQIHQAPPLNAQIHQVSPLNTQIHHTPVNAHIHQTPPAQIHHVPVSVQMHTVPVNTQIQKNHMNPVSVSTPVHQTTLTPQIHGTTTIQQSYVVPISNAYSVTQYVPITPNPHQTGQSGNLHQTSPTYHPSLQTQQQIAPPTVSNLQMASKFGSPPRTEHSRPIIVGGRLIGTHITRIEAVSDSSASESDCDADEKVAASTNGSWNGMRTRRGRLEESEEDEVGKTGRIRKRVRYNEDSEEGELSNSVSSRGRVRKANTRMRDFI